MLDYMNLLSLFFNNVSNSFCNDYSLKKTTTKRYISAMSIQSIYRMYIERKNLDKKMKSIITIQQWWRKHLRKRQKSLMVSKIYKKKKKYSKKNKNKKSK
tara:strand:- start:123 stop:422 length:300 start_codon:yes stop_codon:yes gene_type:complete